MGGRLLLLVVLTVLLSSLASATIDIRGELEGIAADFREQFKEGFDSDVESSVMIVKGQQLSPAEELALEVMKKEDDNADLIDKVTYSADEVDVSELLITGKTIFVVGGPSQNQFAKALLEENVVQAPSITGNIFAKVEGANEFGGSFFIVSSLKSFENLEREGARKSPLAKLVEPIYVPAAASLIMVILTYLLSLFKVFEGKFIAALGQKRSKIKESYFGFKVKHFHFKTREYVAISIGALVYAAGIALNFTGIDWKIIGLMKLTALVTLSLFFFKEIFRLYLSYKMKLHTEYKLWYPGMLFTLIGGWLGNTFNAVGFMLEKKDEEGYSDAKAGCIRYLIVWALFIAGIAFYFVNTFNPSQYAQMIMISASTAAIVEMFPIKPMYGPAIKKWRPVLWFCTLVLLIFMYCVMNFVF